MGLLSKIVSIDEIGNDQTSIKNYIVNEYNNHNIQYVLFAGDINEICHSEHPDYHIWGDYWYSDLNGDYLPEIALGRISATSTEEVTHITQKGIKYETDPYISDWTKNVLLVAHLERAPYEPSFQWCSEQIRTYSYDDNPIFTTAYGASIENEGDEATNADVSSHINDLMGVVNYRGHGSGYYWYDWNIFNEDYDRNCVYNLSNVQLPIVFSIACNTSHLFATNDCLAEAFTKADYGAAAFLGATGETIGAVNNMLNKE